MFISPSCLFDDVEIHGVLADSAYPEATVYATAGTKALASGTGASTFVEADGIAFGMPTSKSATLICVDA
jgi:hypothetical protein